MSEQSSEDYANYRMSKAKTTIAEIEVLIENEFWNLAVNRMYYACFYAVSALLVKSGVHTNSHTGTRQQFGQLFVQKGHFEKRLAKHYTRLFEKRQKGGL